MEFDRLRLRPGARVDLARLDPADTTGFRGGKRRAEARLPGLIAELDRLQELLYADGRYGMLVVLQGVDTSGKDGTIRNVFEGVNPQGVRVSSFKVPTPFEAAHDFLWRVHRQVPGKGEIVIFNRSHYEDVLVARVHHLVPARIWSKRYHAINQFEKELVEEGVPVVKFFLHISREEQRRRLEERLTDRSKRWKLSPADLQERPFWPQYMASYQEMLRRTTTRWAPWYVIPADHKWFRNLAISSLLTERLAALDLRYPTPTVTTRSLPIL